MSAIVNGEGGVIINGESGGGGGASLPDTPANVLLDASAPNKVVVLDGSGAGTTGTAEEIVDTGISETCAAVSAPSGSTLIYDAIDGDTDVCSATVAALLAATRLVFDQVVNVATHTTNNNSAHQLLTITCDTNNRAYTFRGTISAARDDYSNAYAWDIIATLSNNGSLALRTSLITPTDPTAPYTVAVSRSGNQLHVDVTGATGHNVQWHGGGFLTVYGA